MKRRHMKTHLVDCLIELALRFGLLLDNAVDCGTGAEHRLERAHGGLLVQHENVAHIDRGGLAFSSYVLTGKNTSMPTHE